MLVIIIPIIGALRKDHAKFHAKNNVYCYTETHFNIEENACLQWNATRQDYPSQFGIFKQKWEILEKNGVVGQSVKLMLTN